jgi:6-phosphogluconolactonase
MHRRPLHPAQGHSKGMLFTSTRRTTLLGLATLLAVGSSSCGKGDDDGGRSFVYVGGDGNITWYSMDATKGSLEKEGTLEYPLSASWIVKTADNKFLYALLRTTNEAAATMAMTPFEGYIQAYSIDQKTGALKEIGKRFSSHGDRPTYLTLDKTEKWALVANNLGHLVGNSLAVFPIKADGTLGDAVQTLNAGTDPANMDKPFIRSHSIRLDPSNKYAYVPNIDSDTISQFKFDAKTGKLTPNDPPAIAIPNQAFPTTSTSPTNLKMGVGPRHLDFHPNGKWVYLSAEYGAVVVTLSINANGTLKMMEPGVSGLPAEYSTDPGDKWQSEIRVHPTGKFLYVGQRARTPMVTDQTVAIMEIDQKTGLLELKANVPTLGKTPRNLALDPTGTWLVVGNQDPAKPTDMPQPKYPFSSVVTYRIDQATGMPKKAFGPIEQKNPFVLLFVTLP